MSFDPHGAEASPALVAFDLDDTLAVSKSAVTPAMARALADLLAVRPVCVISGGRFEQFRDQMLNHLPADADLSELHIMPTCGTRYLRHDGEQWVERYAHDLSDDQKRRAIASLEKHARDLGLWEDDALVTGDRIEDRGSQITFSALGQQAAVADKKQWDPSGKKRLTLRAAVQDDLPDLEVRAGGSTSIDITERGIDKAHGMSALAAETKLGLDDMLFIGDRLDPGGNDYPVAELGVPCLPVEGPNDTLVLIRNLISDMANDQERS